MTTYVTTFYSFKGGVGRTTLLVNAACVLADRGERVLLWDLDLEAPGVHHFPGLGPSERLWQSGFLEWLGDTPRCPTPEPTAAWPSEAWLNLLGDRVYAAHGEHRGTIFVLPALGTHANLGNRYAEVDWNALFVEHPDHGLHLLRRARDALVARYEPTFVLIDSRTGVSDLGGFLTGLLPDCTVLVGNYGAQSTEGLRSVYLALDRFATERVQSEPHRHRKLDRLMVASPVPESLAARERGRERWFRGFPGVAPRTLIEVPLVEDLLYAEDVLVRTAPSSSAARAYRAVAEHLVELRAAHVRTEPKNATPLVERAQMENVIRLLQGLGLETTMSDGAELTARERTPLGNRTYHVDYLEGSVGAPPEMRDMLERLRARQCSSSDQLLMIADAARDDARWAADAAGVTLRTIGELLEQIVDLGAYTATVRRMFEDSELARSYVAPRIVIEHCTEDALAHAMSWATGHGPQLLLLVGEAGSGKTSFVRRLAYELATRVDVDTTMPVPVLIDLRDTGPSRTLASLLQQHLSVALGWHGNPDAILHLWDVGRIILLCDGLDEFFDNPPDAAYSRLQWLASSTAVPGRSVAGRRMLVTTRCNVLPEATSAQQIFGRLSPQVVTMAPFDRSQISTFLTHRLGTVAALAFDRILLAPALTELASRPMLLQLLADSLIASDNPFEGSITTVTLYNHYVTRWLDTRSPGSRVLPGQRTRMLEQLAAELWRRRTRQLPLPLLIDVFHDIEALDLTASRLELELRTAPCILRTASDEYGFSHDTFLEYFFARHLASCFRSNIDVLRQALATEPVTQHCARLFAELVADRPDAHSAIQSIALGPYMPEASENALRIAAAIRPGPESSEPC